MQATHEEGRNVGLASNSKEQPTDSPSPGMVISLSSVRIQGNPDKTPIDWTHCSAAAFKFFNPLSKCLPMSPLIPTKTSMTFIM